jgi:hypothetical protein
MEVAEESTMAVAGNNVEYEMMQDEAASVVEDQKMDTMDYSAPASSTNAHDEDYEVMMEEYREGEEGEGVVAVQPIGGEEEAAEAGMMEVLSSTMDEEEHVEEEMIDSEHVGEDGVAEEHENIGDEQDYRDEENEEPDVIIETQVVEIEPTQEETEEAALHLDEDGEAGVQDEAVEEIESEYGEEREGKPDLDAQEEAVQDVEEITGDRYLEIPVLDELADARYSKPAVDAVAAAEDKEEDTANVEGTAPAEELGTDEVDAEDPPAVRISFNGQDFVLFSETEPSTYLSAQQEEPIAAPRLKASPKTFYETLDSLFEALRVKDSLGDFLEEGSELVISFVDLDMALREVSRADLRALTMVALSDPKHGLVFLSSAG